MKSWIPIIFSLFLIFKSILSVELIGLSREYITFWRDDIQGVSKNRTTLKLNISKFVLFNQKSFDSSKQSRRIILKPILHFFLTKTRKIESWSQRMSSKNFSFSQFFGHNWRHLIFKKIVLEIWNSISRDLITTKR